MKYAILIEQVSNGFLIAVTNQENWKEVKTVHDTAGGAMAQLEKVVFGLKADALAITAGEAGTEPRSVEEDPFR